MNNFELKYDFYIVCSVDHDILNNFAFAGKKMHVRKDSLKEE